MGEFDGSALINSNVSSLSSLILEMGELYKEAFPFMKESYVEKIVVKRLDNIIKDEKLELIPEILIKLDV